MTKDLPLTFERNLYRAVIRFKQDHPGVLEARTEERRKRNAERLRIESMPVLRGEGARTNGVRF